MTSADGNESLVRSRCRKILFGALASRWLRDDLANHIDADVTLYDVGNASGPVEITARRVEEQSRIQRAEQRDEIRQEIGGARQR